MKIDSIKNGIVIDHIQAGKAMVLYRLLHLDELDCPVAIIKNVASRKIGKKDMIKIDAHIELDLDVLGYIDPDATVNIIENEQLIRKYHPELPARITNVVRCKNPRCITSTEQGIDQVFVLTDVENRIYRCLYCESKP